VDAQSLSEQMTPVVAMIWRRRESCRKARPKAEADLPDHGADTSLAYAGERGH